MTTQSIYTSPPMPEEPPFDPVGYPMPETPTPETPTPETPRYTIHLASEALEPQPPIEWIVEGVFSAGSVSELVGDPKCGKTYALLDCGVSVAMGERWLGYAVRQGPVLIIDEESGPRRLKRRLGDAMRGHNAGPELDLYFITLARFDMWDADDVTALQCAIEDTGARFVIVDALADIMPGRDENAVRDCQPVFMALRDIAEATQAAIVIVHHNNKAGTSRGSTSIPGAVDLEMSVKKVDSVLTFKSERARDVDTFTFAARMNFGPDSFNLSPAVTADARPTFNKAQEFVLRYLSEHGPSLLTEIQAHADTCSENAAKQAVYALSSKGFLTRVDDGGPGAKATYGLTTEGRAACPQPV